MQMITKIILKISTIQKKDKEKEKESQWKNRNFRSSQREQREQNENHRDEREQEKITGKKIIKNHVKDPHTNPFRHHWKHK